MPPHTKATGQSVSPRSAPSHQHDAARGARGPVLTPGIEAREATKGHVPTAWVLPRQALHLCMKHTEHCSVSFASCGHCALAAASSTLGKQLGSRELLWSRAALRSHEAFHVQWSGREQGPPAALRLTMRAVTQT